MRQKDLTETERRLFETVVRPAMSYGAEIWTSEQSDLRRLETNEMRRELFGTCRCSELIVQRRLCRHDKVSKCEAYHILRSTERLEIADEEGRGNDGWVALNRINGLSMEPQLLEREKKYVSEKEKNVINFDNTALTVRIHRWIYVCQ
ncbi:hypothetical protein ACOME3_004014 [Neoechinorhynchus agilis]